jgi:hypothetical protein
LVYGLWLYKNNTFLSKTKTNSFFFLKKSFFRLRPVK